MGVIEKLCKTALSYSGLSGLEYSLNPYRGCIHACLYCYVPSMTGEKRKWGSFVEVKTNLPQVLEKEVRKKRRGVVGIGTITDPYQPVESKYRITRQCLEVLAEYKWPVSVQTKSSLVLRDLDILKKMESEVGITITAFDDSVRKNFEPFASSIQERLEALKKLHSEGIKTYAFIGPILPGLTERNLEGLVQALAGRVSYVMADRFRIRQGIRECVEPMLREKYPEIMGMWRDAFSSNYFQGMTLKIKNLCQIYEIPFIEKHPFKRIVQMKLE